MAKSINREKNKSLTFEVNPQLFWAIFTAVIGVTFFLAYNFGQQSGSKEIADRDKQITTIARDTQNVYSRLIDSLRVSVTLLDTKTDSKRVSQLRSQLNQFKFITTDRFGIDDSLTGNIARKPTILIAHWHSYRTSSIDAHDELSESQLLKTIQQYSNVNPDIKVFIFSTTFGDKNERERLTSKKIPNLQNPINAFPLHADNEDETLSIIAKVLSTSVDQIRNFTN